MAYNSQLQASVRAEVERYYGKAGPFPMLHVTAGTYGDERYRATMRLVDAGELELVHDRWGWSYVQPAGSPDPEGTYWRNRT
jgi:hypothetical protein